MDRKICVFASSSDALDQIFYDTAKELGKAMADRKYNLVYGGSDLGLMRALAKELQTHGRKVIGVVPEAIKDRALAYGGADQMIVTKDLHERKQTMEQLADAFIALPGGFGTIDELSESLVLKHLQFHEKPIVILNIDHCYDGLQQQFDYMIAHSFAEKDSPTLYHFTSSVQDALNYIDHYRPIPREYKWVQKKDEKKD